MKKRTILLFITILLIITFCSGYIDEEYNNLSDKIFRLHVIANSNSQEDQALKLLVRDAVLAEMEVLTEGMTDSKETEEAANNNKERLLSIADAVIKENGYTYDVSIDIGEFEFPTKDYDTFSLPAGEYSALRVTIGEGAGENWWCVIFPPLCMFSASENELESIAVDSGLSESEVSLITETDSGYKIKFKSLEIWNKIKMIFD